MFKQKYLWIILIIILAVAISFYVIYNKGKDGDIGKTEEEIKEFEEEDIEINEAPVKIEIKKAVIFKDNEPHLNIQLNKCIADMGSKSMELAGEVVIETKEGDILKGDRFYWDSEEETLASLEPVELTVKENNIIADWFLSDVELNKIELQGNVKVTFKTE